MVQPDDASRHLAEMPEYAEFKKGKLYALLGSLPSTCQPLTKLKRREDYVEYLDGFYASMRALVSNGLATKGERTPVPKRAAVSDASDATPPPAGTPLQSAAYLVQQAQNAKDAQDAQDASDSKIAADAQKAQDAKDAAEIRIAAVAQQVKDASARKSLQSALERSSGGTKHVQRIKVPQRRSRREEDDDDDDDEDDDDDSRRGRKRGRKEGAPISPLTVHIAQLLDIDAEDFVSALPLSMETKRTWKEPYVWPHVFLLPLAIPWSDFRSSYGSFGPLTVAFRHQLDLEYGSSQSATITKVIDIFLSVAESVKDRKDITGLVENRPVVVWRLRLITSVATERLYFILLNVCYPNVLDLFSID